MNKSILYILISLCVVIFTQCTDSVEDQLKSLVKEKNKKCPEMLDQWTRLDSCAVLPNLTVKSYHTISSIVITDTTIVKANLSPQIVGGIKINPDARFYRENDVTLIYQYNDSKSNYLFTITVTPKDYK